MATLALGKHYLTLEVGDATIGICQAKHHGGLSRHPLEPVALTLLDRTTSMRRRPRRHIVRITEMGYGYRPRRT